AIFTSEVPPRMGANARRAINVPLNKGEISIDQVIDLDTMSSRASRALLTSSLIQWAASDLPARREFVAHHRIDYMNLLREAGAPPKRKPCCWPRCAPTSQPPSITPATPTAPAPPAPVSSRPCVAPYARATCTSPPLPAAASHPSGLTGGGGCPSRQGQITSR